MPIQVSERVHIMPVGYEESRIIESAKEYKADRVELITHSQNDPKGQDCIDEVESTLENKEFECHVHECDIFDLYDSIGTIAQLISEHEGDDVYVNISTGTKITAVAGTIATTVTDTSAYYVKASEYGGDEGKPVGIEKEFELPHYPIEAPDDQQVAMLAVLHELEVEEDKYPTKGELIHIAMHNDLEFIKSVSEEKQARYRALDRAILDPLYNREYIDMHREGRNKIVELTEQGKGAYQAFNSLIDTDRINIDYGTVRDT